MPLDDVAPSIEAEAFRPDGQRAEQGYALDSLVTGNVGLVMDTIADNGMHVSPTHPLNCLQRGTDARNRGSRL